MATVADIGVAGQPLNSPPLTAWQAAVRDALTLGTRADLTPSSGFAAYVGSFCVTRVGALVAIEGFLRHPTGFSATGGTAITLTTLPAGFRPPTATGGHALWTPTAGYTFLPVRLGVDPATGVVQIYPPATATVPANGGWVVLNTTFRGA